jgi:hypothetical protein
MAGVTITKNILFFDNVELNKCHYYIYVQNHVWEIRGFDPSKIPTRSQLMIIINYFIIPFFIKKDLIKNHLWIICFKLIYISSSS